MLIIIIWICFFSYHLSTWLTTLPIVHDGLKLKILLPKIQTLSSEYIMVCSIRNHKLNGKIINVDKLVDTTGIGNTYSHPE